MFENWNRFVQEVTTGRYKDGKLNDAPFLAGHSTTIFSAKFY